jgi:hypothetical protein
MLTDPANRFFEFFGPLILFMLCFLTADLGTAEGVAASGDLPAKAKFSCMIANSVYGSPSFDEPVRRLHQFRDQVLMGSAIGRWVARGYYRLSGSLVPYLDGDDLSRGALRWTIRAFLYLVKYLEAGGLAIGVVLMVFLLGRGTKRAVKTSPR